MISLLPRDQLHQFDNWVEHPHDNGDRPEHWSYRVRGSTQHFYARTNGSRALDGIAKEWVWFPTTSQVVRYLLDIHRNNWLSPYSRRPSAWIRFPSPDRGSLRLDGPFPR